MAALRAPVPDPIEARSRPQGESRVGARARAGAKCCRRVYNELLQPFYLCPVPPAVSTSLSPLILLSICLSIAVGYLYSPCSVVHSVSVVAPRKTKRDFQKCPSSFQFGIERPLQHLSLTFPAQLTYALIDGWMDECLPGQEDEEEKAAAAAEDEATTRATMATSCVDCCGQRAVCTFCPSPLPGTHPRRIHTCQLQLKEFASYF